MSIFWKISEIFAGGKFEELEESLNNIRKITNTFCNIS